MSTGIDIIALGRKSLISIFERKKVEKTSIQEVEEINRFIDDNISKESITGAPFSPMTIWCFLFNTAMCLLKLWIIVINSF